MNRNNVIRNPPLLGRRRAAATVAATAAMLLGLSLMGHSQAKSGSLLVLSKHDHTLAIVDPATLGVLARVPVGEDPHEVIASTDGTTAYVSNYGFGAFHTLAVVDLQTRQARPSIDLGALSGPHGLTFVGGETWFTAEGAKAFGRYDPRSGKIDLVLGTGQNRTHMIWASPDEQHIVVTNVSSGTVSLIDREPVHMPGPPPGGPAASGGPGGPGDPGGPGKPPPTRMDWNETVIPVGNGSEGFDVSPDRRFVWVANAQDGTVSVIDLLEKRVVDTLAADVPGANRLKFTPDGRRVLLSTLGGPQAGPQDSFGPPTANIVVLDVATRKVIKRIAAGRGAAGIVMQPDGARAYVACTPDNYVAVVDLHSLEVVGRIKAGDEPDGLAWSTR